MGHPEQNQRLAADWTPSDRLLRSRLVDIGLGRYDRLRQVLHDYFAGRP
jgi:hypothetical protein